MPYRRRTWLVVALAGVGVFALSWLLRPVDEPLGRALVGLPVLVDLAGGLAFVGAYSFLGPAAIGAGVALAAVGRAWGGARIVLVTLVSDAAARLLKSVFERARPEYILAETPGFSFPSGHATTGAALAVLAAWFATRHLKGRVPVLAGVGAAAAWACAMAASRLVVGAHYASDVVAGVGLGMSVAGLLLALTIELEHRVAFARLRRTGDTRALEQADAR